MSFPTPPESLPPPAMTASRRGRGTPANLLTLKSLLAGGGGLAAAILLIRALPAIGYRLHLPLWVFYALLLGGGAVTYFLGRRMAALQRARPRTRPPTLDDVALRRLPRAMLVFKTLPVLVVAFGVAWLVVYDHVTVMLAWAALGFAIIWRMVWPSLWKLLFWR